MKEEEIKKLNIYEKLSLITDEINTIEKKIKIEFSGKSYKAVSERDVLDAVKPLERKYRVYSYPSKREIIDKDILVNESEYKGNVKRTNSLFMRVETTYKFINIDCPNEWIETTVYGDGLDTGDKAPGKAMTYADKYALMKAYKLSTGDDPDKEASPESGYSKVKENEQELSLIYLNKMNNLVAETNTDYDKLLANYKVSSNKEMTLEQLKNAVSILEQKKAKSKEEVF